MKRLIPCLLVICAILASCSGDKLKERDYTRPGGNRVAFSLSATLVDGSSYLWDRSAQIGIFGDNETVNVPCSIAASTAGTEDGLFYSNLDWKTTGPNVLIYYPYNEDNTEARLTGTIPQTYSGQGLSALSKSNMFYARTEGRAPENGAVLPLTLSQVLSVVSLSVSGSDYTGWNIERISVKSKDGSTLSGSYNFDISSGEFSFGTDRSDSLAVLLPSGLITEEGITVYWLSQDVSAAYDASFELMVTKEGEKNRLLSGSGSISGADNSIDINPFEVVIAKDEAIDLSSPDGENVETANCYVAGLAGTTYKFPATVMGNGLTLAADPSYAPSTGGTAPGIVPSPLAPVSATILWQTERDLIGNIRLKDGYIYFTTNGTNGGQLTPGNAVIAAWSDADGSGTILWSWHIWVTDVDLASKLQTWKGHSSLNSYSAYLDPILMDRNLGALSTDDYSETGSNNSIGLNYQWGRKDPFIGPDNSSITSRIALVTYDGSGNPIPSVSAAMGFSNAVKWTHVDQQLSKPDIAKYPMAFVSGASNYFWLENAPDDLWGCPGYPDNANTIGTKTIYDPCPPGYRVMNAYAMSGVTSSVTGGKLDNVTHSVLNRESYREGENLRLICDGDETVAKLPASGLVFFEKGENGFPFDRVGTYGHIWSAKKTNNNINRAWRMHFDWNTFTSMEGSYGSYGHNVRCEKIKE